MEGAFLGDPVFGCGSDCTLIAVDISSKTVIKKLEQDVKKKTGLTWFVTEADPTRALISWELLLPIKGGKIHITAQSNTDRPLLIYGFQIHEDELFMKALKQIAVKKTL